VELLSNQLLPYSIAFAVFLLFGILELLSLIIGVGVSEFINVDYNSDFSLGGMFSYLNPQKIPLSMVIISFFFIFGFMGIALNNLFGILELYISLPIIAIITIVLVRHLTQLLDRILPKKTTQAVSQESFIAQIGVIVDTISKRGTPARVKLKDRFNEIHYIRVEPMNDDEIFKEGDEVVILSKKGAIFLGHKRVG